MEAGFSMGQDSPQRSKEANVLMSPYRGISSSFMDPLVYVYFL